MHYLNGLTLRLMTMLLTPKRCKQSNKPDYNQKSQIFLINIDLLIWSAVKLHVSLF